MNDLPLSDDPTLTAAERPRARYVRGSDAARFWAKVDRSGDCWTWIGAVDPNGYGRFRLRAGRTCLAHRFAFEQIVGSVSVELDHLCRNPSCVNPAHLDPVEHQENMARGAWRMRTRCPHGHPYDHDNTIWTKRGHRQCRACAHANNRKQYLHRKGHA